MNRVTNNIDQKEFDYMKTFMKRIVSAIIVGAMSAALLSGCGSQGTSGGTKAGDAALTMEQGSVTMGEARLYA